VVSSLILSAAPAAQLYVADIYGGSPTGGASSAMTRALAWLAEQRTPVINVSLVGPRNRIVEAAVAQLVRRGFLIVAAVGNDGPAAPPLYPAAYPGVVGVTGVDQRGRVLVEAGRGPQVDFAALGMAEVAASSGRATRVRGTSYASPIVAALLALETGEPSAVPGRSLLEAGPHAGASRGDPR
jgi:subtilisin family serine protease